MHNITFLKWGEKMDEPKNMVIEAKTKERMAAYGKKDETYNDIINMLLDFYEKHKECVLNA